MPIPFVKDFDPDYGTAVTLNPQVRRLTVHNPSPFTFTGTNSYIIGSDTLAIIDPGPEDDAHFKNLLRATAGHTISHIFITHCHMDHSPLAKRLSEATGAIIVAEGPYRAARIRGTDEETALDASSQSDFVPDIALKDGESIEGDGWVLSCVTTPGHMANHAAFALENSGILFSGDHVMAWATTVVAPPDGSMKDYMQSLDKLLKRDDRVYLPGHGGAVYKPHHFVRAMKAHRKMRECAILQRICEGDHNIESIVKAIYRDTDPRLHKAAALSVFAHIEDLVERGLVKTDGVARLNGSYSAS